MRLALTFVGIQCFLHIVSVSSTLSGKNKSPKQFTLSCSGMDYSIRKQRKAQNENENSSESFKGLYPEGQEVLYTYSAVVTTGTKSPAHFVSQFNLTGNIKVQGFKNKARVQFLNLKYTIYSGDFLAEKKLKTAKLPEIAATLYEPFDIFYKDGQVEKLDMTPGTLPWSKSIIQALSGILQLHLPKIHTEKFTSFISSEQSIHGNCAVLYSVKPMKNKLHVTKFYSTDDCQRESTQWSNVEDAPGCSNDEPLDEKLESYSLKTYRVTPYGDDTLLIREVFSEGKTYKYLGKNTNSSHYISVSQKLQLVSMNDITRVSEISNPEEVRTLEYDARQFSSFKFSTNEDVKNVVKKIFQLFPAVRHELDGPNSLTSVEVNPQEPHLIPLLITYLRKLDFHMLKQIYNELEKMNNTSSMDRFTKLLPLVGGKDSALFLVKLVKNNKIRNFDAELLISSLPFHTRQLSAEHLTEFEDLLYLPENISSNIRNAAVLSFATLVYRTCKYDVCSAEITNKYTLHYIENSNEFLKQLVYLAGLSNLRLENIADFFEPIISGEEPVSGECIRVFGLRAVFPVIAANPEKAYEVYWPIFVNRENSLELRATALVLLLEAQQESSIFMQLYQIMTSDELNSHLYNIYYKLIKSYSEDNKIRNSARTHIARQIVKSMKKPAIAQFPSSHYTFSFADGEIKILAVFNPKIEEGISLYISYSAKYTDSSTTSYSAYIKIIGIDGDFLNNLLFKIYDSSALEEVLKKVIKSKLIHENIRIEIILFSQQQVVSLRSYDRSNIEDFLEDLISLLQIDEIAKFSWFYATSFFNKEIFFVTDLGFPGVLSLDSPILSSFRSQPIAVNTTQATEVYKSFDLRYWSQASIVLKVKNTMVDIWQGVIRSHTSHFNFPLTFKINFENQRSLLLRPAKENNHTGFKWHSQTDIFTVTNNENYDALTVSCKVCASTSSVKHKIAQNVQSKVRNKGYSLFSKIFDCEDDESLNLLKFIPNFSSPNLINTLGTIFSAGVTLEKHLLGLPISGSCGFSTAYTQSKEYVVCFNPTIRRNNFTLLVGGSESSKECVTDDTIISLTIEGSSEDYDKKELKGECKRKLSAGFEEKLKEQFKRKGRSCGVATSNGFEENQEWCEKEMKPQIMSCIQAEMNERGQENVLKLDVKVKQLPKDLEEAVSLLLNDHQKDQSDSGQRKEEDKTKHDTNATLIINFAKTLVHRRRNLRILLERCSPVDKQNPILIHIRLQGYAPQAFKAPRCQCLPGFTGPACNTPTIPTTFKPQSYVKYALSFEPDRFSTQIQLRFRTREEHGELFRVSDQHNREYAILEIKDSKLHFRYNLNSLRTEEKDIWLSAITVDDGQWHVAKVSRYGSSATLELDGGEGRRYNESFTFDGHQWLLVDKQEGVYAGGKAEYTGVRTFEVYADYQKGCLDDIRLEGKHLPLPPAMNGTQWGQATMARNLEKNCPSNKPCANVICPDPFECVDLWNEYECTCPEGFRMQGIDCVNEDECEWQPCLNGGVCRDYSDSRRYACKCPAGYTGLHCELELLQSGFIQPSKDFIIAVIICLILLLILVLVFVVYNRRREAHIKYPGPDDDVRENIINYDDEGGGEDDMTAFDITPLQIPIGGPLPEMAPKLAFPPLGQEPNVGVFIEEHKKRADCDPNAPPFDDLRNYAYEGGGSTAGSLSSLASGTDDEQQDYDYLGAWGPRFDKLADMYGQDGESEEEEEQ